MHDALILTGVTKHYGDDQAVLWDFSHTFEAGTATGLVGPNGSGKTTLIRLLSLASFPSEGRITYKGNAIQNQPHQYLRNVGLVHDTAELPEYLSATEWLEYVIRSREKWNHDSSTLISSVLDEVLLDERRERLIGTYSSGMKKKTQIAAALVCNPEILLLDEPLRGLDSEAHEAAVERFRSYTGTGGLLVIASHMQESLDSLCTSFVRLGAEQQNQSV